jgi:hypothetical protein
MYALIGKGVVRFTVYYVRTRYRRQLRIGAALAAVGVGIAIYWANREVPEG